MKRFSHLFFSLIIFFIAIEGSLSANDPQASTSSTKLINEQSVPNEQEPVRAKLISEQQSVVPGQPFLVGIQLEMQKGWDTYWLNPGDAGFATKVSWQLPKGFQAGTLQWPYPERFDNESMVIFGYANKTLILTEITPPKDLELGKEITLEADVNWLACSDSCIPGQAHLVLTLPVADQTLYSTYQAEFAVTKGLLPHSADFWEARLDVKAKEENVVVKLRPNQGAFGEIEHMVFIPEEKGIDYHAPQTFQQAQGEFVLNIPKDGKHKLPIKGVLLVSEKGSTIKKAIQIDTSHTGDVSLLLAIGLAFLGGIILNVMPCVLPVIALKIFSFVKLAQEKRWAILQHGLVFSAGVMLSFWVVSGILLGLRAYGESIGWGFQLQEPIFVAVLASIIFLLGLSLFGVFEMGTSLISLGNRSSKGLTGSFMSGILATLVATPCTGPMLGPAIGFAMTLPAIEALTIFSFVAIGMAFPYLFLSCFPQLVRFLPKPGNWMVTFKHLMGFLMMATVLWLLWVFSAQTDLIALFALLFTFMVMAVAAWIFGRYATAVRPKKTRQIATIVALFLLCSSAFFSFRIVQHSSHHQEASEQLNFSALNIQALRKEGPVFVDFTAKWCLICQANKMVLHSPEVQFAFQEKGVKFLEADWTKRDPEITEELQKLGRSGVPVYAIYPSDLSQKPLILPQNLTKNIVQEYLDKLPITIVQK